MIKLKIKNWLQKEDDYKEIVGQLPNGRNIYKMLYRCCTEKPYDEEKWKDGKKYEFKTLKDAKLFTNSCDIELEDDRHEALSFTLDIDPSEDNLLVFEIYQYYLD